MHFINIAVGQHTTPSDALPIIADELRGILAPANESGSVSILTLNLTNIEMATMSAQNEAEDALDGLDAAFDAKDK